jgi:hypothetical protein
LFIGREAIKLVQDAAEFVGDSIPTQNFKKLV